MSRMVGSIPTPSLWAGISTVVRCDRAPGPTTEEFPHLRKAKQPASTSKNQTNVRRAGRQTIAITAPLTMAHIQSGTPLCNASLHQIAMHFRLVGVYDEFDVEQAESIALIDASER